ncbi:MAG: nucleotide sugar dehydrogenase [Actinobacteria bacterium]|nr:nucleotide sugar dehydrogenase [Actinomycetota bacterium]
MNGPKVHLVVIGLGYVGLPVVLEAVHAGLSCSGLDNSSRIVTGLNSGVSHVDDISDDQVKELLHMGFQAFSDPKVLQNADVAVICVPTPLNEDQSPNLDAVISASQTIRDFLHPGMLVVLESTTYPGTTDGLVRGILEESGLVAGRDFNLAFSPERIDPGNPQYGLKNTPKVVGGFTPACTERAANFYSLFVDTVVRTRGTREAELAKLLENTYRHVNIALVNEMSIFCHELGIDLWDSIDAAATKPFGFTAFYPGPGVGGHCIPIDPNYLSYQVRSLGYQFRFVELAEEISNRMPGYVVRRVQDLLNEHSQSLKGAKVLLLGLTYKPNISDQRETPSRDVANLLIEKGALVTGFDPHVSHFDVDTGDLPLATDLKEALGDCDVAVLLQTHSVFDLDEIARLAPRVFDTRGRMRHDNVERL